MKSVRSVVLALAVVANAAFAQTTDAPKDTARWTTGTTKLYVGTTQLGLGLLNANLAVNQRPTFDNAIPILGLSTYARWGRLRAGASAEGSLPHRKSQPGWITKLSAGSATLDAGYVLLDASSMAISATTSIGIRSTSLHFEQAGDFSYEEGLENPARGVDLLSHGGIVHFGLDAERRFATSRLGQFSLSVEMGMARPLGAAATYSGENRVLSTPRQSSGRFLRVAVGKPIPRRGRALDTVGAALLSMIVR